jgi:hypothetical protein
MLATSSSGPARRAQIEPAADDHEHRRHGEHRRRGRQHGDHADRERGGEEGGPGGHHRGDRHRHDDRRRGDGHGARRRRCRARDGRADVAVVLLGQLLAHARDEQQRVVDGEREAHHAGDRQGERVEAHVPGQQRERAGRRRDRGGAEGRRDRRGQRRAEDEQQGEQEQRQRDELGAVDGRQRGARAVARQQRLAGDRRAHGRRDARRHELLQGLRLLARSRDREQEQRAVGRRAQRTPARRGRPGAEDAHARALGQRGRERNALSLDSRLRPLQEDRDGRRVTEVPADQVVGARGLRAGDLQAVGRQPAVDAESHDPQHCHDGEPCRQHGPGMRQCEAGGCGRGPAAPAGRRLHRRVPCQSVSAAPAGCQLRDHRRPRRRT